MDTLDKILSDTYGYFMSTATLGTRDTRKELDPEDVRVGETLKALLFRNEIDPKGYLVRRPITHDEMAQNVRTLRAPRGVSRTYITRLCNGEMHMSNEALYQIAAYLGVDPIAIKRPDLTNGQYTLTAA